MTEKNEKLINIHNNLITNPNKILTETTDYIILQNNQLYNENGIPIETFEGLPRLITSNEVNLAINKLNNN